MGKRKRYNRKGRQSSFRGGHTYLNPNVIPELRTDKKGNPVIKLVNKNKTDKQNLTKKTKERFTEHIRSKLNDTELEYIRKWFDDFYYDTVKQLFLYDSGVAKNDIKKTLDNLEKIEFTQTRKIKSTLNKIFNEYNGSGIDTIYRGISTEISDFLKHYPDLYNYYKGINDKLRKAKEGDIIELDFKDPTSWTKDELMALSFTTRNKEEFGGEFEIWYSTKSNDNFGLEFDSIVERKDINPNNIDDYVIEIQGDIAKNNGYDVEDISVFPEEQEVILKPVKGKFKVAYKKVYEYVFYDTRMDDYISKTVVKMKLISI